MPEVFSAAVQAAERSTRAAVTLFAKRKRNEGLYSPFARSAPTCRRASWFRIQYLLTWNCKHLANANKFEHIQVVNARRRLVSPALITPAQLLEIEP